MEMLIHTCRFAESAVQFQAIGSGARRLAQLLFGGLPREHGLPICLTYQLVQDGGTYQVYRDGELDLVTPHAGVAALHLLAGARRAFAGRCCADGLVLRAACLAYRGKGLLLPGAAGCGKSTLAAWLLQAGFEYLTDELVFLPWRQDGQPPVMCQGFNCPLTLAHSGIALFPEAAALARASGDQIDTPSGAIIPPAYFYKQVPLPVSPLPEIPLAGIIFPRYQPGTAFHFGGLSPKHTAQRLLECVVNPAREPEHGLKAARFVSQLAPGYELHYNRFLQVLPSVREALGLTAASAV